MSNSIRDKVLVITGASSGIGLLTACKAADAGAQVFLISRNGERLAAIVDELQRKGGSAAFAVADVADCAAVEAAAAAAAERFGRIDCWINNAGIAIYAKLLETPLAEHRRLFEVNYFGTVHGAQAAMPHLERSGGTLITVGSIAGDMPSPIMGAYAASKHAIHAYVTALRIELKAAGSPVRIALIKPSGMTTPIARHAANHQEGEAMIPPPPYDPQLVARAILHAVERKVERLTVGGVGRLEVLFAAHFPRLFERLAPVVVPFLSSKSQPRTLANNLWRPGVGNAARTPDEKGRSFSLMFAARRHPLLTAGLVLTGAAVAARRLARRRA